MNAIVAYFVGASTGALTIWYVAVMRHELGPNTHELARDAVAGHVFKIAVSDVVDSDTGAEIKERTNELYDEYELPGDPHMEYHTDNEGRE